MRDPLTLNEDEARFVVRALHITEDETGHLLDAEIELMKRLEGVVGNG